MDRSTSIPGRYPLARPFLIVPVKPSQRSTGESKHRTRPRIHTLAHRRARDRHRPFRAKWESTLTCEREERLGLPRRSGCQHHLPAAALTTPPWDKRVVVGTEHLPHVHARVTGGQGKDGQHETNINKTPRAGSLLGLLT